MRLHKLLVLFFLLPFSVFSQQLDWVNTFGGPDPTNDYEYGTNINIDSKGNTIHLGIYYLGGTFKTNLTTYPIFSNNTYGSVITKLDKQGNVIWFRKFHNVRSQMAIDKNDNIYLIGGLSDTIIYETSNSIQTFIPTASYLNHPYGSFICKIDSTGNLSWIHDIDCHYNTIGIDNNNDILIAGATFRNADVVAGSDSYWVNGNSGVRSEFIIKMDGNCNLIWGKLHTLTGSYINSFSFDKFNNIVITGTFSGVTFRPNSWQNSKGGYDIFIRKMNPRGVFVWSRSIGGIRNDHSGGLDLDSIGNIYLGGYFGDTVDFDPYGGTQYLYASSFSDMFVLKLDSTGHFQWVNHLEGFGRVHTLKLINNKILTGGFYRDSMNLIGPNNNFTILSNGYSDMFYSEIGTNGTILSVSHFGGLLGDYIYDIAQDKQNNIYLSGAYEDSINFGTSLVPRNYLSNGRYDGFILKLSNSGTVDINNILPKKNNFSIYPNPSDMFIIIESPQAFNGDIIIRNSMGQIVNKNLNVNIESIYEIETGLKSGIYFLELHTHHNHSKEVLKFIQK